MHNRARYIAAASLIGLILFASLADLDRVPQPWWDEGWTLNVAKNWVERGYYGQLLDGAPAPPGLSASFPTVASVALSFKLLGVGVWQGRLAIVFYTFLALALLYWLAARLYDRRVALAALILLVILAPYPFLSPVYMGRQVLAEMPMLFFLLLGYVAFWLALNRSTWWLLAAPLAWGIALVVKAQALPFWAASLILPLVILVPKRRWKLAGLMVAMLIGSYLVSGWAGRLQGLILNGHTLSSPALPGIYEVTALVTAAPAREDALTRVLLMGLPALLGLTYGTVRTWQSAKSGFAPINRELLRLMLLTLGGTWFAWYVLLSVGLERYLFPAVFVSSIFTAAALADATAQFNFSASLARLRNDLRQRRLGRSTLFLVVALAALAETLPLVALTWLPNFIPADFSSLDGVAAFLSTHTPRDALIESYDSEVLFATDRRYHYPPDEINVTAIERTLLKQNVPYDYDPLAADPDYLVVGSFVRNWQIYDAVLAAGKFKPVYHNGHYDVYERVR